MFREDLAKEEMSGLGAGAAGDMVKVMERPVMREERARSHGAVCCLSELGRSLWWELLEEALQSFSFLLTPNTRVQIVPSRELKSWWESLLLKSLALGRPFKHISVSF